MKRNVGVAARERATVEGSPRERIRIEQTPLETGAAVRDPALVRLREAVDAHHSLLVAFSGGVDSTLVLKVAHDQLGDRTAAALAVSESLPASERREAEDLARTIGVRLYLVRTNEISDRRYSANPLNRCYFCKSELFGVLSEEAHRLGFAKIAYGANLDDRGDFRPGMQAADELGAVAPLIEAGLGKSEIRRLAKALGLPNWDKPARACLSSRIPHGVEVTPERLEAIERAEEALYGLGFRQVRVRWHGDVARIELAEGEIGRLLERQSRLRVSEAVRAAGFRFVALDLDGYRQGSLNLLSPVPGAAQPNDPTEEGGQ